MPDDQRGAMPVFNPRDFGARGDGAAKDTAAIQRAIAACSKAGGGTVCVPAGRYLTGPIYLAGYVTLYLEGGAVLLGSTDRNDYKVVERRYSGTTQLTLEALINGDDQEKVTLSGRGTIDGQGEAFWKPIRDFYALPKARRPKYAIKGLTEEDVRDNIFFRPRLVEPVRCRDLRIEGVTLQNSGFWNLNMMFCKNVVVDGVTFSNPDEACNGDGMDINSCQDVRVSNCLLSVGDDCICLKSGWDEDGPRYGMATENVTVTNCITRAGHGGVVMGSDMSGGIRNVVVSNCVFQGTEIGIRLKTMRGRGAAVENINVSNLIMENVPHPIHMDMHYYKPKPPEPVSERTPCFRNLRFSHIDATGAEAAAFLHGLEEMPIRNVRIDGMRVESKKPFRAKNVQGLELRNLRLECAEGPELDLEDVSDVEIDRFQARGSHTPSAAVRLARARQVFVHDSSAVCGAGHLIELRNTAPAEVREANNCVL